MDVSAQTIRQVEFREKLRGYHQDDVDEFLERVAAGIDILQERLRVATERAVRAEQQASESSEDDDSLKRTLVLAQRTADLAVKEGREQAELILDEARAEAAAMVAAAEEDARRLGAESQAHVRADVERLEAERRQLEHDVERLSSYLDEQRARLKGVLEAVARDLDGALTPSPLPGQAAGEASYGAGAGDGAGVGAADPAGIAAGVDVGGQGVNDVGVEPIASDEPAGSDVPRSF